MKNYLLIPCRRCLLVLPLLLAGLLSLAQPYTVNVTTFTVPPVNPVINQAINSGQVSCMLLKTVVGTPGQQAVVFGRIDCLSPSAFSITVNASYTPQPAFTLTPNVPLQLTPAMMASALGNFSLNNLTATGINLSTLVDPNNNLTLPAGTYRICFAARGFTAAGGLGGYISDPNLGCGNFTINSTQPAGAVTITSLATPPLSPLVRQAIGAGQLHSLVQFNNPGGPGVQVKLFASLQCLSPQPFTISLNPNYQQQAPLNLTPGVPVQLSAGQLLDAFGNLNPGNLVFSGISPAQVLQGNELSLPDGTYRFCLYARYYTANGLGGNASDPNLGCSSFTLCSKVSAPQFSAPVNNFDISSPLPTVNPASPLLFSWTAPSSTCGNMRSLVAYDFEIHAILPSQTVTDAINNPIVFQKKQLPSASFLLDTMLYKNILQAGGRYVVRVRATSSSNPELQFDNNGYSRVEAFQYGTVPALVNNNNNPPPKDSSGGGGGGNPPPNATGADCGVTPPANTTLIDGSISLKGEKIKVGEFTLVPASITRNGDGTYSGQGTIDWSPAGLTIKLAVLFDKVKINSTKELIDGLVTSSTNSQVLQNETFSSFKDLTAKAGGDLDKMSHDVEDFLNKNAAAHLVSQITGNTPVDFPIGLNNQSIGGVPATLAIMSMVFGPKGATMALLFDVNIPEANGWLSLAGTNFCVKPDGVSLSQGTLYLPTDRDFNIGSGGNQLNIKFKGCPTADSTAGTYVAWSGGKLADIVAHAEISFPRNAIVPEDNNYVIQPGPVVAKILFKFHDWNDWIATVDLPHFQINGVAGLSFEPSTIYYDHSTKTDAPAFTVPDKYVKPGGNSFEGLYIKDLKVLLPPDFKTFNQGKDRTSFDAHDVIIDDDGVSTHLVGSKIIDLSTGDLGGWAFSLDTVQVLVLKNTFQSGSLNGQIKLPVSTTPLNYSGDIHVADSLSYEFVVQPAADMKFDIWKAELQLDKNSAFRVAKDDKGTAVGAVLNGNISFTLTEGSPAIKIQAITFDSLGIANRNPSTHNSEFWFSAGNWSLEGIPLNKSSSFLPPEGNPEGQVLSGPHQDSEINWANYSAPASPFDDGGQGNVSGFPISLNSIAPYVGMDGGELKLGAKFDINLNLGFGDKSVISVSTDFMVYGKVQVNVVGKAPEIDFGGFGIDIDSIKVKGDVGPVSIEGYLVFYKHDNTYGDGLKGHVSATFPMLAAEATAQFGNVNNYNYWYIDAYIALPAPGIPVGAGVVSILGFGGGAYYNMQMQGSLPADVTKAKDPSAAYNKTPGATMSGVTFVPQPNTFGLRASLGVGISAPDVANAKVTMTAEIHDGALQDLDLQGDVFVMTDYPENKSATVRGHVDINYDFVKNIFSLTAAIDASLGPVTAHIPIAIHAGPDGWFFKLGDAWGDRVSFTLIDMKSDLFSAHVGATAYMMMGSLLKVGLPDLPTEITSFGVQRDPSVDKFVNAVRDAPGSGFMFGARVDGSLSFNFAMLYARVQAIIGFDLALKNFSPQLTCNGQAAGWDNWYALGQLYFYFDLDVGIHVDVWFFSGDLDLVQFKAGALLSGGLPNPTWLDGSVHVQGSVLNGLISVNTSAHFSIGDKCYPTPDPLKDIKIISDYGPKDKVDVFDLPYAAANLPLNTNYDILVPPTKDKPEGETRTYRFVISAFTLKKHNGGQLVNGSVDYSNSNQTATLKRTVMLDGKTQYDAEIICYAQQYNNSNSTWEDPYNDKDGKKEPVQEVTDFSFTTGPAPDYIPAANVHFQYPVDRQRYVLKQELGGNARLQVNQWQGNILKTNANKFSAGTMNHSYVCFIDVDAHDTVKTDFTPDISSNTLSFQLPAQLKNNASYRVEFWSVESNMTAKSLLALNSTLTTRNLKGVDYQVKTTTVSGVARAAALAPKPIYTYYFRTSQYNSFSDKLASYGNWNATAAKNGLAITSDGAGAENFDELEAKGFKAPDGTPYPAIFGVNIPWTGNKQNDKFADDNIYARAFVLAFYQVATDFGAREVRGNGLDDGLKPVNAIDWWTGFLVKPPLNNSEAGIQVTGPVSKTSSLSVSKGLSSGISMYASQANKGFASKSLGMTIPAVSFGSTIYWNREKYLHSDFDLMNGFGLLALTTEGAQKINQMSESDADQAFGGLDGDYTFISNSLGGSVHIPWTWLYHLYQTPANIDMFRALRDMNYTPYAKGARAIQFSYRPGNFNGSNISKSFNY